MTSLLIAALAASAQCETLRMTTYPYSDPDPVPAVAEKRYPYFRYDGSAERGEMRDWSAVVLENDRIRVTLMPSVGGKVWGARDKASGMDFIYHNHVVKFRDIAQRGPWTSGGIEFNFGTMGHAPSSATPVDWAVRTNADRSVSFFAAASEYVTRTRWQVEVRLAPGKDAFETRTTWYNASLLPQSYYHWMNAAYSLEGNPRFLFPGSAYVGHEGDAHAWPRDDAGHDLSVYRGNAFGGPKSYHVLQGAGGAYGIWWPERGVGSVHRANAWEKYGRKIWLWALSREGGIWEDLLTDSDGQYAELQSGRYFLQPRYGNYATPFKHPVFAPGSTEVFAETWGVLRDPAALAGEAGERAPAERPLAAPKNFDWTSSWGRFVRGEQYLRECEYAKAEGELDAALALDGNLSPALVARAAIEMRRGDYAACHGFCNRALAIDTADEDANYLDGFAFFAEGDTVSARDRLGLAAFGARNRAAALALIARSYLRDGDRAKAVAAADRALAANALQFDALLTRLAALRGTARAKTEAAALLDRFPLFHAARYELEGTNFMRAVRNELPDETVLDLASWYAESGLAADAERLLALAPSNPVALIRRGEYAAAKRLPAAGVFPFRRESLPALRRAAEADGHWKFRYYLAVALAAFNRGREADAILESVAEADEAVFYQVRARRRKGAARLADLERARTLGDSWRIGRDLASHYAEAADWPKALSVAGEYVRRFPSVNPLKILYAKALCESGRHRECLDYLKGVTILPSEHRGSATDIWQKSQKALGLELTWPENLGKGKPYPDAQ